VCVCVCAHAHECSRYPCIHCYIECISLVNFSSTFISSVGSAVLLRASLAIISDFITFLNNRANQGAAMKILGGSRVSNLIMLALNVLATFNKNFWLCFNSTSVC